MYVIREYLIGLGLDPETAIQIQTKHLRKYVSGQMYGFDGQMYVKNRDKSRDTFPLYMRITHGIDQDPKIVGLTIGIEKNQMLLNCLKTSGMDKDIKFKYFFKDKECNIVKQQSAQGENQGDNVIITLPDGTAHPYNGGCLVKIEYPIVHICSNAVIEKKPKSIPTDYKGNLMEWRSLYIEKARCRATGREYKSEYNFVLKDNCKPYGWWDSDYIFLSKEAAQDRECPSAEPKSEYTFKDENGQVNTYRDIIWKNQAFKVLDEQYGECDIIKNGMTGEGFYTCNEGQLFISVEAVTIQDPVTVGEIITLQELLRKKCIPEDFNLQIIANEGGTLTYLGYIRSSGKSSGNAKLVLQKKFVVDWMVSNLDVYIEFPQEIVYNKKSRKKFLREIMDTEDTEDTEKTEAQMRWEEIREPGPKSIPINNTIEGQYYGLEERGLYFFVVSIDKEPPMSMSATKVVPVEKEQILRF